MTTTNLKNSQVRTNSHTRAISPNELRNLQASPKHKQLDNDILNHILRHLKCILSQVNRQHDNIF